MFNIHNKLSDFFKEVDKAEEKVAKKKAGSEATPIAESPLAPQPRAIEIEGPAQESTGAVATAVETKQVVASVPVDVESDTGTPRPIGGQPERRTALFEDSDVPQVEDFFSFLSKSSSGESAVAEPDPEIFDVPKDQGTLRFAEGTGVPRPVPMEPIPEPPKPLHEPARAQSAPDTAPVVKPAPQPEVTPIPAEPKPAAPVVAPVVSVAAVESAVQEKWDRLPHHLQTLFNADAGEVAQNSYKTFRETRAQLIERLLDPVISLEEAARILNVCPTTVRRYTNRGVLRCLRTAGNQRRFKLSDVLRFMEGPNGSGVEMVEEAEAV